MAKVGIRKLGKTVTAVSDTEAGSNLLKESSRQQIWARPGVKIKARRLRSAVCTQLKLKGEGRSTAGSSIRIESSRNQLFSID